MSISGRTATDRMIGLHTVIVGVAGLAMGAVIAEGQGLVGHAIKQDAKSPTDRSEPAQRNRRSVVKISIRVHDAETDEPLGPPIDVSGLVSGVTLSPDGKRVIATADQKTRLWDASSGRAIDRPRGAGSGPGAFSPDGTLFALGVEKRGVSEVRIWDVALDEESEEEVDVVAPPYGVSGHGERPTVSGRIRSVTWTGPRAITLKVDWYGK